MAQGGRTPTVTGEWECMECGYTEEGNEAQHPQKCPECSAPADALEFFPYSDEEEAEEEAWDDELDEEEYEEYEDLDDGDDEDDLDED
jgi:hypothetical protein